MERYKKRFKESSLSRIWSHNLEHDCGAITAFRVDDACEDGIPYTKKEKQQRNKSLKAHLVQRGYGVTKIMGKYIEDNKTVKEETFFVVDIKNSKKLLKDLKKLGKQFNQDSILFAPQGSLNNETDAFYVGTNHCDTWLKHGEIKYIGRGKLGKAGADYGSYINGRPFIFENVERIRIGSTFNALLIDSITKKHWKEISILILIGFLI